AIDRVVDEDHGDRNAELRRADDLRETDRRQVTVALITDHDRFRVRRFVTDGDRRSAAVRGLRVADVEVVIEKDAATDRRDGDRAVLDAELVDRFSQELVGEAVSAARAVVGRLALQALAVGVALEALIKHRGAHTGTSMPSTMAWVISCCCGRMPPKWRTLSMTGRWNTPQWLNASRSSSSS